IFQERRTPASGFQRILVVRDDDALIGGERRLSAFSRLVRSASWISDEVLLRIFEIVEAFRLACLCHSGAPERMRVQAATPREAIRLERANAGQTPRLISSALG